MGADFPPIQLPHLILPFLLLLLYHNATPCEIESGEPVIIMDIPESIGNQSGQTTIPSMLPIRGDRKEIFLKIVSDPENIFVLNGKELSLKRPLDRDLKDISTIPIQIRCTNISSNIQKTIPVKIRVKDLNDNAPRFVNLPYVVDIAETSPIGTTVFSSLQTADDDSSINSLVEYFIVPGDGAKSDGYTTFAIDYPLNGDVILKQNLNYDQIDRYEATIIAVDRASKPNQRLTSTATLTINVLPDASSTTTEDACAELGGHCSTPLLITSKFLGIVNVSKVDLNLTHYSIENDLKLKAEADDNKLIENQTESENSTEKTVDDIPVSEKLINVRPDVIDKLSNESSEASVRATSTVGFVRPHSPVGTAVLANTQSKEKVRLMVIDYRTNFDGKWSNDNYEFELSTNKFSINNEGFLLVSDETLDLTNATSDQIVFQVSVRKKPSLHPSSPITLTVYVVEEANHNAPHIQPIKPLTIASSDDLIYVTQVRAFDDDIADHVAYSIGNVTNDGDDKFWIDNVTGVVKTTQKLAEGETYRLTLQAKDQRGRMASEVMEVSVASPQGRLAPTMSARHIFDVQVSEAVTVGSSILSLQPGPTLITDVTYSIMEGNEDERFDLNPVTGVLIVRQALDRETVSHYALGLRAIDKFGLTTNTIVNVEVTDINDNNPAFLGEPYVFYVNENLVNVIIGRVRAVDADAWVNGAVYYAAPSNAPIAVDEVTGEVRTIAALDYEKQAVEYVIISAKDGGTQPRIATVTVTIRIIDVPDEIPYFRRKVYDGAVPENMANMDIVQVTAYDADAYKQITYVIRSGPLNKFTVDPTTGVVRTIWPLDYEESSSYFLIIGTRENQFENPDATCMVRITVLDRNDISPQFTSVPSSVILKDDLQAGTIVTKLSAVDKDGTPPNNIIKYHLSNSNGAKNYFEIDDDLGIIILKGDLKQETSNKLQLEVKVYDMGTPQLTSTTKIPITIDHKQKSKPEMAFEDTSQKAEVEENALGNTVVKVVKVLNKPTARTAQESINCEIIDGNDLDHFYVQLSPSSDCELKTKGQKLDFESRQKYQITMALTSTSVPIDKVRSRTQITVQVKDVNDNRPAFVYNQPMHQLIGQRHVAALSRDLSSLTPFTKVTAIDSDSASFGDVVYQIINRSPQDSYFAVDSETGLVSNVRTFDSVDKNTSTLRMTIMARDNPQSRNNFLNSTTNLTVNLISDEHRLVLVILDAVPEKVVKQKDKLVTMLQVNTKYVVNVEKIESRKLINNSKVVSDAGGTDVWLNVIDPDTLQIVRLEDNQLHKFLLDNHQQKNLLFSMSTALELKVESIRSPISSSSLTPKTPELKKADHDLDGFQAALIALGGIIAILGFAGIIYICVIWTRYVTYRDHLLRLSLAPKYEPVLFEPNLKPYETQVLRMNVNNDDNSSSNEESYTNFDFNRPIDDVSYLHKDTFHDVSTLEAGHSSSSTESDSLEIADHAMFSPSLASRSGRSERVTFADVMRPARNPIYHSSDENGGSPTEEIVRLPLKRPGTAMVTTEL